jgi:hypothetical protein
MKLLLTLLGGAAFWHFSKLGNTLTGLKFSLYGLKKLRFSLTEVSADLVINFNNPAEQSVDVTNLYIIIEKEGTQLATISRTDAFTVASLDSTQAQIPSKLSLAGLLAVAPDIYTHKQVKNLRAHGHFRANGTKIPVDELITLSV